MRIVSLQGATLNGKRARDLRDLLKIAEPIHMADGTQCPDCSAVFKDNSLTHDPTCPVGLNGDQQLTDDRVWFERHPDADERQRPAFFSERVTYLEMGGLPPHPLAELYATVTQLAPGARFKRFSWILPFGGTL